MIFEMKSLFLKNFDPVTFTEETAPKWLKEGGKKGSTMDRRWFWEGHVMTLKIGESVCTDYNRIKRIK